MAGDGETVESFTSDCPSQPPDRWTWVKHGPATSGTPSKSDAVSPTRTGQSQRQCPGRVRTDRCSGRRVDASSRLPRCVVLTRSASSLIMAHCVDGKPATRLSKSHQSPMLQLGQVFGCCRLGMLALAGHCRWLSTRSLHMRCNSICMYVAAIVSRTAGGYTRCDGCCVSPIAIV